MNDGGNIYKLFYIRTLEPSVDVSFEDDNPEEIECIDNFVLEVEIKAEIEAEIETLAESKNPIVLFNNQHYFNDG